MTDRPIPTQADPEADPEAQPVFGLSEESVVDGAEAGDPDLEGLLTVNSRALCSGVPGLPGDVISTALKMYVI